MQKSSHILKEIIEVRARSAYTDAYSLALSSLGDLQRLYEERKIIPVQLLNYFPVSIISCLESFLRLSLKEIIDSGDVYLERAGKLSASLKFDFDTIKALQGKHVTLGEFISHSLSMGSIEHINFNFSTLLNLDFMASLRTIEDRWAHEIEKKPKQAILSNPNKVFSAVTEAFRIRHIICHELPNHDEIKPAQIEESFEGTALFIRASSELISNTLNPNAPLTQTDMNIHAGNDLDAAFKELESANKDLINTLNEEAKKQFLESHELWKASTDAWAAFAADYFIGGSIRPLIYATTAENLVRYRIQLVNDHFKEWKDR